MTYVQQLKQSQAIDYFKMCGFHSCQPLDSNSSFLIENKDPDVRRDGLLWLCQKAVFNIGYSVPVRKQRVSLIRQISDAMPGGRGTWIVDYDDLIDMIGAMEEEKENRKEPDHPSKADSKISSCSTATWHERFFKHQLHCY